MPYLLTDYIREAVALLAEGVDRNNGFDIPGYLEDVALLAEGVDRNSKKKFT